MSFLQPWMLLGLLAAAVPVILHLMNRQRAQRVRFPMLTLVSKSQDQRRTTLKIKRWLLLAARIGVLLLIPLAMAQPYTLCGEQRAGSGDRYPAAVVVIVDVSASMGRVQKQDVRDEAQKIARRTIRGLKAWDQVRVLVAGDEMRWLNHRWTSDHQAALSAVSDIPWEEGRSNLPAAIVEARSQLMEAQLPLKKVFVITDNDAGAWASEDFHADDAQGLGELIVLPVEIDDSTLEFSVSNLVWDEPPSGAQDLLELRARIDAHGRGRAEAVVHLEIDGEALSVQRLELEGGTHQDVVFTHAFKDDDVHVVRVHVEGAGVQGAQERWMPVYLAKSVRALLVNGASSATQRNDELYFLSRALDVDVGERQSVHVSTVTPERMDARALEEFDVVVLANVEAVGDVMRDALKEFVREGGGLWITAGSHVRADQYNRSFGDLLPQRLRSVTKLSDADDPDANIRATRFASIDYRSPLFQMFSMPGGQSIQSARVFSYLLLEPDAESRAAVLASYADGGPAIVEAPYGRGRVLLWTTSVDADWTDLPIRTAYVPLVHRTLRYLAQRGASDAQSSEVGESLSFDLSGLHAEKLRFEHSGGTRIILDVEDEFAHMTPEYPGVYHATLVQNGEDFRAPSYDFALNVPVDEAAYTAVDAAVPKAWAAAAERGAPRGDLADTDENRQRIWPTLLLIALLLLYLESLLGVRRRVWESIAQRMGGGSGSDLRRPDKTA